MKIYTRAGDGGETGLLGPGRIPKDSPRIEATGDVDELDASLGLARSLGLDPALAVKVGRIQEELHTLGAQLACPDSGAAVKLPRVQAAWVDALEQEMDAVEEEVGELTHFILPGGTPGAAGLHLARAVCRRAERAAVGLSREGPLEPLVLAYLNRLSDWLFVLARVANRRGGVAEKAPHPPEL